MRENGIKYPIGIQTFEEIVKGGYIYVDKTDLIYKLVTENKYIFLSRPRRFGKTLLISTIEAFFKGRRELFKGLAIDKIEKDWPDHPVLRLDLSMDSFESVDKLIGFLSGKLDYWEEEYGINKVENYSVAQRFERVIRIASQLTGRRVIILVDEYDKPIVDALEDPTLHDVMRQRLQGFYSVIKGADPYIHFVMLTGVGKFAHLSIFSGLNNLNDVSLDDPYNTICGVSEAEMHRYFGEAVKVFAEANSISEEETWQRFKKHYDGYHFSRNGEDVYNPFSVLNAFSKNQIGDYWFRSGTPSFLVKLVRRNDIELGVLDDTSAPESQLNNITDSTGALVPLMFQAGYLTIKGWDFETQEYRLGFPNEEVKRGFWDYFIHSYFPAVSGSGVFSLSALVKDLNSGHADQFLQRLQSLIADTSSETERNKEIHFQNIMAIIGKMLGFRVRTEVHSSLGRCDMILETSCYIYIFEFKLNKTGEDALTQIKSSGYERPFMADTREKILVVANFSSETRTIEDWVIERI